MNPQPAPAKLPAKPPVKPHVEAEPQPPGSRVRWRAPIVIAALALAAIVALHQREWIESYVAAYATAFVVILATVALAAWFALASGLPARARFRGLGIFAGVVVAAIVLVKLTTRVEGTVSGVGVPRLVWKWSARPGEGSAALPPAISPIGAPVRLWPVTPQDFPEFLGPGRLNRVYGAGLSKDWSTAPRQLWRQPIGLGWSAFAVVGSYAVTQEQRGESELVICYEVATGKARWEHANQNARFSEWQGGDGPRATPTIVDGMVYAMGATGILDCLDGQTGKLVWSHNILTDAHTRNQEYGKSCSPLVFDHLVIVTGGSGGPSLAAYDKANGSAVWAAGDETPGYASPIAARLAGADQILTVNAHSVTAHGPSDGRILWRFNWPGSMPKNIQPVALDGDRVLISAGYGLGTTILQVHFNRGEFWVTPTWTSRHLKPKLSNVAVRGNYVYGLDDGILTCVDLATGKRMWRGEEYGFGQVLGVDDLLLVQAESGDVAIVDAAPDAFRELGRFSAIAGKTWTGPALAGHHLLVRNDHEAACYLLP